jgi:hypothetical protein
MASFLRGTTITPTTTVTATTLHNLIELATVTGLTGSDVPGGAYFTAAQTATPNPSLSPFWFDPTPVDPIFRVFAAPWNIWLAAGPDRFEIPLRNGSGTLCAWGCLVVPSGPSEFTLPGASGASLNALGFLQSDTAAGSVGAVATMGIGWALYSSAASKALAQNNNPPAVTDFVVPATPGTSILGTVGAFLSTSGPSSCLFGMWLDSNRVDGSPASSGPLVRKRVLIWGPRLPNGL